MVTCFSTVRGSLIPVVCCSRLWDNLTQISRPAASAGGSPRHAEIHPPMFIIPGGQANALPPERSCSSLWTRNTITQFGVASKAAQTQWCVIRPQAHLMVSPEKKKVKEVKETPSHVPGHVVFHIPKHASSYRAQMVEAMFEPALCSDQCSKIRSSQCWATGGPQQRG